MKIRIGGRAILMPYHVLVQLHTDRHELLHNDGIKFDNMRLQIVMVVSFEKQSGRLKLGLNILTGIF